ncbi:MAG TPA: Ig-like domain-containing protein [Acidimicrobiales bacterium]|nr:Ig-like domain-containing protein [Acidimicrobiales bacterium]
MRKALAGITSVALVTGLMLLALAIPAGAAITTPTANQTVSGAVTITDNGAQSGGQIVTFLGVTITSCSGSTTTIVTNSANTTVFAPAGVSSTAGSIPQTVTWNSDSFPNGTYTIKPSEVKKSNSCLTTTTTTTPQIVVTLNNPGALVYGGVTTGAPGTTAAVKATLTDARGVAAPDGQTVTFSLSNGSGSPSVVTGTTTAGVATANLPITGVPRNATLTTSYAGGFYGATSVNTAFTVTPDPTTAAVSSSVNPTVFGQPTTFTAHLASAVSGVTFDNGGTVQFAVSGTNFGAPVAISGGTASLTDAAIPVSASPASVTATYSGDPNFSGSSGSLSGGQAVTPAATTLALVGSPTGSTNFGESVDYTATVTDATGVGAPNGTVSFTETISGGSTQNIGGAVTLTPVPGSPQQSAATSASIAVLTPGTYTIAAVFHPTNTNFATSNSSLNQIVTSAGTMITVTSTANPSVFGQPVQYTAQVSATPPGSGTPTGSVKFQIGDDGFSNTQTLSGGQATSSADAGLAPGSHTVSVAYTNTDGNFSSTSVSFSQVVDQDPTTTTVTTSPNPTVFGQPVTFSASVAADAPGAGTATGTVEFQINGQNYESDSLSGGSVSATPDAALAPGTYTVTAIYSGDPNFVTSTGTAKHVVNQDPTTTGVTSSVSPSVFGQPVTFTATVSANAPGAGTPTGSVTFLDGGTPLGTQALNGVAGNDQASITVSSLSVGTHAISAVYGADVDFLTSTGTVTQSVNQDQTTTTVTPNGAVVQGQPVSFNATVAPVAPGAGTPTGTVKFTINGAPLGTPVVVTGGPSGSVATSASISSLNPGTYTLTATYSGDNNFLTSAGTSGQPVTVAQTTTTLVVAPNPVQLAQPLTLTATVAPVAPGTGTPTGSVDFFNGTNLLGSGTLSGGTASLTLSSLSPGAHSLTASYLGEADYAASSSAAVSETVGLIPTTTAVTSGPTPSSFGQPVTLTATVAPVAPGTGTPTGAVSFYNGSTLLGTGTLAAGTGGDQASLVVSSLPVGSNAISATYSGDPSYGTSSTTHSATQVVGAAATNLTATPYTQQGVVSATLTTAWGPVVGQPLLIQTGSVAQHDLQTICTANTDASGTVTCTGSSFNMAVNNGYNVTYAGSTNYKPSTVHGT